jgi:hypothetical protein
VSAIGALEVPTLGGVFKSPTCFGDMKFIDETLILSRFNLKQQNLVEEGATFVNQNYLPRFSCDHIPIQSIWSQLDY